MIPDTIKLELTALMKEAGKLLLFYWNKKNLKIDKKGDKTLVTEADLASEKFLIDSLQKLFPIADFLTEESGAFGSNKSGYCWVIDPLDGTRNFAFHIPYFCISVALTYKDRPIIGAIYNPIVDELFYAQEGTGAWCNDIPLRVSTPPSFTESFIAFGLSYTRSPAYRLPVIKAAQKLVGTVVAVRHMGAVALDMANVAIGRFDGLMCISLCWWDVAAGTIIIEEAGGKVREINGSRLGPHFTSCIAGSPLIFDNLVKLFDNESI